MFGSYRKVISIPKDFQWKVLFYDEKDEDLTLTDLEILEGKNLIGIFFLKFFSKNSFFFLKKKIIIRKRRWKISSIKIRIQFRKCKLCNNACSRNHKNGYINWILFFAPKTRK